MRDRADRAYWPADEAALFALLDKLGVNYRVHRHAAVFTVDEARALRGKIHGGHNKCLFLKDKTGRRFLAVVDENRRVDLKALTRHLQAKRLSFASAARLQETLGVAPGSVTPLALINAAPPADGDAPLRVLLDRAMLENDPLNYHPLHNEATVSLAPEDLLHFIRHCGYEPEVIDFDNLADGAA